MLCKVVGVTPEYTTGDKVIAWSVFCYSFLYKFVLAFAAVVIWNFFSPWPKEWWDTYFYITILAVPMVAGIITTVWFLWGGLRDSRQLFIDLEKRVTDDRDNGQVMKEE